MTYDDQHLYVAAKCYSKGNNFVITSLRRDYRAGGNDNITFVFDTFRDRTNAIVFGMNPLGVTREALISNGGSDDDFFDEFWDNKWHGVSRIHDGYWSCELAIPFSSLRFREGDTEWFFNCYRFDMQANVQSTWNRIPQNQIIMSLGYMGNMIWDEPRRIGVTQDPSTGQNLQNPIYAGARLSGKLDNNWRIGLLSMQAARNTAIGQPSTNYTAAAMQRKIFSRSN